MIAELQARYWIRAIDLDPQASWGVRLPVLGEPLRRRRMRMREEARHKLVSLFPSSPLVRAAVNRWLRSLAQAERACDLLSDLIDRGQDVSSVLAPDALLELVACVPPGEAKWRRLLEKLVRKDADARRALEAGLRNVESAPKILSVIPIGHLLYLGFSPEICEHLLNAAWTKLRTGGARDRDAESTISVLLQMLAQGGDASKARAGAALRTMCRETPPYAEQFLRFSLMRLIPSCLRPTEWEDAYRDLLGNASEVIRAEALTGLVQRRPPNELVDELLVASRGETKDLVWAAAKHLEGLIGDPRVDQRFFEALEIGDLLIQCSSARRLGEVSAENFERLCGYFSEETPPHVARRISEHLPSSSDRRVPLAMLFRGVAAKKITPFATAEELNKWNDEELRPFTRECVATLQTCDLAPPSYHEALAKRLLSFVTRLSPDELSEFVPSLLMFARRTPAQVPESDLALQLLRSVSGAAKNEEIVRLFVESAQIPSNLARRSIWEFVESLGDVRASELSLHVLSQVVRPWDEAAVGAAIARAVRLGPSVRETMLAFGLRHFAWEITARGHTTMPPGGALDSLNRALSPLIDPASLLDRVCAGPPHFFLLQMAFQTAMRADIDSRTRARLVAASRFVGCDDGARATPFKASCHDEAMIYLETLLKNLDYITEKNLDRLRGIWWDSDGGSGMTGYWSAIKGDLNETLTRGSEWLRKAFAETSCAGVTLQARSGPEACLLLSASFGSPQERQTSVRIADSCGYHWIDTWIAYQSASAMPDPDPDFRDYSVLTR